MADEFLVLEFIETEAVAALPVVVVILHVCYYPVAYLHLNVLCRGVLLLVAVHGVEVLPDDGAVRYDVCAQIERERRDKDTRDHVRAHQALERNSSGEHGDYLRVAGKLRGEEDYGNEDKQRAEEVGEVGHEVQIVVEYYGFERCLILCELCQVLIDIEYY